MPPRGPMSWSASSRIAEPGFTDSRLLRATIWARWRRCGRSTVNQNAFATALGFGEYSLRVGTRNGSATTWSGTRSVWIDEDAAIPAGAPMLNAEGPGYAADPDGGDPVYGPAAIKSGPDFSPASPPQTDEELGEVGNRPLEWTVPQRYSPTLYFGVHETNYLMTPEAFIEHSDLRWSHAEGCDDHTLDNTPSGTDMGSGQYSHRAVSGFWPFCDHNSTWYDSNDPGIRPRTSGAPGDGSDPEGMFLEITEDRSNVMKGFGLQRTEPAYIRYVYGQYIQYWFFYGSSQMMLGHNPVPFSKHEGDWEHISIRLKSDNTPKTVAYFYHHNSCTLPWSEVPKTASGSPMVWVAWRGHGSYPAGRNQTVGEAVDGAGKKYRPVDHLLSLNAAATSANTPTPWSNYTGSWGEVGSTTNTTGPEGPSYAKRGKFQFGGRKCE